VLRKSIMVPNEWDPFDGQPVAAGSADLAILSFWRWRL
jgi:hypothetical protein